MTPFVPSVTVSWILIAVSGAFEIVFWVLMKQSDGFTRPLPSGIAVAAALVSIWRMTIGLRTLARGPGDAVWAGIGTLGTAIAGVVLYAEPVTPLKATFMLLVVVGIVGLQMVGAE